MSRQARESSRTIYFTAPGTVEIRDDPRPVPGPGQVLLRLQATGICTMEQRLYRGVQQNYPISPGHEPAAEVLEVADGVHYVEPGDHVIVSFLPRCMQCFFCRAGESDKCITRPARPIDGIMKMGGFTQYALAYGYQVFKVADDLPWHEAALGEPLACAIHSIRKADVRFGDDVLIIGGGTMGQLHALLAGLSGARVIMSEPDADKLRVAMENGVNIGIDPTVDDLGEVVGEATEGRGVDAIFITVGGDAGRVALQSLRKGGRAIFYSAYYPPMEWQMDPDWIHHGQVSLIGAINQTADDWLAASRLLSKRLVSVSHLVSARHSMDDIDVAMQAATSGKTFRVIVEMAS